MNIIFNGLEITLLPQKAAFIPLTQTLLIADMHIGRAAHTQQYGITMPQYFDNQDIRRFGELLNAIEPKRVVFLGDLFHSTPNATTSDFLKRLEAYDTEYVLVEGNHDSQHIQELSSIVNKLTINFVTVTKQLLGNITLQHEPTLSDELEIAGHMHPGVSIGSRSIVKLPTFVIRNNSLILPAFSSSAGVYFQFTQPQDTVYAVIEDSIKHIHI